MDPQLARNAPEDLRAVPNRPAVLLHLRRWNLFDDADAWRECLLGTPEERLGAKFPTPSGREALKEGIRWRRMDG